MEKLVQLSLLYDTYQSLLTKTQRDIFEQYYYEDRSLNEIADINKISKQAVSGNLHRAEENLYELEEKMNLLKKNDEMKAFLEKLIPHLTNEELVEEAKTLAQRM